MPHALLDRDQIDEGIEQYLGSIGNIFARFDNLTQDSGNISYGVQVQAQRYFVKTAGHADDPEPLLNHAERIALLHNAIELNATVHHSSLPKLYNVIESPTGPVMIHEWVNGDLLGTSQDKRTDPASAFQRFRRLPASTILNCLDSIFDLHDQIAAAGWVVVDFYDGCLIYDFASGHLSIVDLDTYSKGSFQNNMGRMFGSSRFMSPEEFQSGALIDQQSNVFTMGRTALVLLSDGTLDANAFRGSIDLFEIVARACNPDCSQRFDSMTTFCNAWRVTR